MDVTVVFAEPPAGRQCDHLSVLRPDELVADDATVDLNLLVSNSPTASRVGPIHIS